MPQPNVRDLIVAGPLANVSIAYRNKNYIADRIFPLLNVGPKAKVAKYNKGAWFRDEAGYRAPGTKAKRGGYPVSYVDISTKENAYAKEVTDEDREDAAVPGAPPLKPDQDAVEYCSDKIDMRREVLVATAIVGSSAVWSGLTGGEDAGGLWAAGTGNTFIVDVEYRKEYIRSQTGITPNIMIVSANTLAELKKESTIIARYQYVQPGKVTAALIASLFDLDEVIIGDAVRNVAKEASDGSDFSAQDIWEQSAGKGSAWLGYRPPAPGLKVPCAGYQCRKRYSNGQLRKISTWREPAEHMDVYEVAEEIHVVPTCTDLGFLWHNTIAT